MKYIIAAFGIVSIGLSLMIVGVALRDCVRDIIRIIKS